MPSYNLSILGQEVAFKTDADEKRIREAEKLIAYKFSRLDTEGIRLSREKILLLVALSLADDFLQSNQKLQQVEQRLKQLLEKIDKVK